jgi:uncharacterized protein YndB with AHSA1/START domain
VIVGDIYEKELRIEASPETVFPYFTDPQKMRRWKGVEAELDPRPGGVYRVNVTGNDRVVGEYLEVDPPKRVVFTWGWEGNDGVPPGSSTVEVTLTPDGDGTVVRLVHSGLPDADARAQHGIGWEHFLDRLAVAASGGDPGPDPWATGP